jgi:hypothetical protein
MMAFRKEMRSNDSASTLAPQQVGTKTILRPQAGKAAQKQRSRLANLKAIRKSLKRQASEASSSFGSLESVDEAGSEPSSSQADSVTEQQLLEKDGELVDDELNQYFAEGLIENEDEVNDFDIVNYWNVSLMGIESNNQCI